MTVWIRHGMLDLEIAVLLGDFSDPNVLDCLPQVLSASRLLVCHLNLHNSPQVLDWIEIWAVPMPFQHRDLVFLQELSGYLCSVTRSAILHEYHVAVDVHVQFQLLFEQFHVLGVRQNEIQTRSFTYLGPFSGVRQNEIQTRSATAHHGTPNHLARRVFHCGYNIFLVKTLTH